MLVSLMLSTRSPTAMLLSLHHKHQHEETTGKWALDSWDATDIWLAGYPLAKMAPYPVKYNYS